MTMPKDRKPSKKTDAMPPRHRTPKSSQIYAWRMARGLTQEEAAEVFGISFTTYRRLELMKTLPKRYELAFTTIKQTHPVK
jgi:DNA-binding XRE family transcriptional regulator